MPECSKCGKKVKKLSQYGEELLCKECGGKSSVDENGKVEKEKWLIRTTDSKILGPYKGSYIKELVRSKKIVFLDEIAKPGEDWTLIKNVDYFKDIALGADYSISESTANFDLHAAEEMQEKTKKSVPPAFKKRKVIITEDDYIYEQPRMLKKHNVLLPVIVTLGVVAVVALGFWAFESSRLGSKKESIDDSSDYFNKYYIKGKELEEGGLFKEALKYYHKALAAKPYHSSVRIRKAAIDLVVLSNVSSVEKELQELNSDANIGKIPDQEEQSDIKTFLGILEFKKGNYQSAEGYFNQALAIRPTNAYLYYNIGCVLMKRSDYKGASEYFKNAQKLSSNFSDAVFMEGYSLIKQSKNKEAVKVFNTGVQQNQNMREFYTFGAHASQMSASPQAAFKFLKEAVTLDPYYYKKVFCPLHQIAREDTVSEEIDGIDEIYKTSSDSEKQYAGYVLSLLYLIKGNSGAAVKILETNVYKSEDPIKLMIKGIVEYNQSNQKEAQENISKALAIDYSNQVAHLYAGIMAIEDNNLGQARNHLMKAQAAGEYTSLYAITLMGDVLFKSGEKNTAILMWKKVLSMDSHYTPAWERILNFK